MRGTSCIDPETGFDDDWEMFCDWLCDHEADYYSDYVNDHNTDFLEWSYKKYEFIVPYNPAFSIEEENKYIEASEKWANDNIDSLLVEFINENYDSFRNYCFKHFWSEV